MKPNIILALLVIVVSLSCGKHSPLPITSGPTDDTNIIVSIPKTPDYGAIPASDVKWFLHYQGTMKTKNFGASYYWDTSYHCYSTISSTGEKKIIDSFTYDVYSQSVYTYSTVTNETQSSTKQVYVRYDTVNNNMVIRKANSGSPIFRNLGLENYVGTEPCMFTWKQRNSNTVLGDSILIDGVKVPALYMTYFGKNYFYFSRGIGGVGGIDICPDYSYGTPSAIRSLSFKYKSDSLHFEYPLVEYYP